jgi:methionine-S-sulfoxide reductase
MISKLSVSRLILLLAFFFNWGVNSMAEAKTEIAILAGGCFWCLEGPFDEHAGVLETQVGYSGGTKETANYNQVSKGDSGHYEVVKVIFDPSVTSYKKILEIFWKQIDPTQADGQFADIGPQYRSAIFYMNDKQKFEAEASVAELAKSNKFEKPIVTEIKEAKEFFMAQEDHQDYYKKAPTQYQRYKSGSGRAGFIEKTWGK